MPAQQLRPVRPANGRRVFERGGLASPITERYGIEKIPQAFLIGKDRVLIRDALQASQLEAEGSGLLERAP